MSYKMKQSSKLSSLNLQKMHSHHKQTESCSSTIKTQQISPKHCKFNQLTKQVQQQLNHLGCQSNNSQVLKYPINYLQVYYYQLMKALIMGKDDKCFNTMVSLIDDDTIAMHDRSNNYTQSKIKRLIAIFLYELHQRKSKVRTLDHLYRLLYHEYKDAKQFIILLFQSIFYHQTNLKYTQQKTTFQNACELFSKIFNLSYTKNNNIYNFVSSKVVINQNKKQIYVISLQSQGKLTKPLSHTKNITTLNNILSNSGLSELLSHSNQQNSKIQIISNFKIQTQKVFQSINTLTQSELDNIIAQGYQNTYAGKSQKTVRFKLADNQSSNSLQQSSSVQSSDRNLFQSSLLAQHVRNQCSQNKLNQLLQCQRLSHSKISKLSMIASMTSNTQKTIYDQDDPIQQDQYSELDQQSFSTLKKIISNNNVFKKIQIFNNPSLNIRLFKDISNQSQQIQSNNQQYTKSQQQNKKQNVSKPIKNDFAKMLKNQVNKRIVYQQQVKSIDFKKDKPKRRRSQQNMSQMQKYKSQTPSLVTNKKSDLQNDDSNQNFFKIDHLSNQSTYEPASEPSERLQPTYIIKKSTTPFSNNHYTKYGYINNNISKEFTDSIILKAMDDKYRTHITQIKHKAKQERKEIQAKLTNFDKKKNRLFTQY